MTEAATKKAGRDRELASQPGPIPARASGHETAHEAAVDRLIELASDKRASDKKPVQSLAVAQPKDSSVSSMWKTLQQLKTVLPFLTRLLPLLDARILPLLDLVGLGHAPNSGPSKEVLESLAGLQSDQRELRGSVENQEVEIKRLEDEIAVLREASDRSERAYAALSADLESMRNRLRLVLAGLAVLLAAVAVMAAFLLTRRTH